MKDTLQVGLEHTTRHTVIAAHSVPHLSVPVLATPWMIAMIESCCQEAAQPHLGDGEVTVGTHVCVSHERPTFVDQEYRVRAVVAKIEGRRITFDVVVENDEGRISAGTHQRGIIEFARFS
jgi:fluoroacetyl-CoA thioesterase